MSTVTAVAHSSGAPPSPSVVADMEELAAVEEQELAALRQRLTQQLSRAQQWRDRVLTTVLPTPCDEPPDAAKANLSSSSPLPETIPAHRRGNPQDWGLSIPHTGPLHPLDWGVIYPHIPERPEWDPKTRATQGLVHAALQSTGVPFQEPYAVIAARLATADPIPPGQSMGHYPVMHSPSSC
eukprot:RCo031564